MPDVREPDPVAAANQAIRDHIRAIEDSTEPADQTGRYGDLLAVWTAAVDAQHKDLPLAA